VCREGGGAYTWRNKQDIRGGGAAGENYKGWVIFGYDKPLFMFWFCALGEQETACQHALGAMALCEDRRGLNPKPFTLNPVIMWWVWICVATGQGGVATGQGESASASPESYHDARARSSVLERARILPSSLPPSLPPLFLPPFLPSSLLSSFLPSSLPPSSLPSSLPPSLPPLFLPPSLPPSSLRALCVPTLSHFLIVNKTSVSPSLSPARR